MVMCAAHFAPEDAGVLVPEFNSVTWCACRTNHSPPPEFGSGPNRNEGDSIVVTAATGRLRLWSYRQPGVVKKCSVAHGSIERFGIQTNGHAPTGTRHDVRSDQALHRTCLVKV